MVPDYLKQILVITGFECRQTFATLSSEHFDELQSEIERKMHEIAKENRNATLINSLKEQLKQYHINIDDFKLPFGHKKLLEAIAKFCSSSLECVAGGHEKQKVKGKEEEFSRLSAKFLELTCKFIDENFESDPNLKAKICLSVLKDEWKAKCPICSSECKLSTKNGILKICNFKQHMMNKHLGKRNENSTTLQSENSIENLAEESMPAEETLPSSTDLETSENQTLAVSAVSPEVVNFGASSSTTKQLACEGGQSGHNTTTKSATKRKNMQDDNQRKVIFNVCGIFLFISMQFQIDVRFIKTEPMTTRKNTRNKRK